MYNQRRVIKIELALKHFIKTQYNKTRSASNLRHLQEGNDNDNKTLLMKILHIPPNRIRLHNILK